MTHWYLKDGSASHQILGANKKLRDVTLRDARKLNLFPSTTGITQTMAAPGLIRWQVNQAIKATMRVLGVFDASVATPKFDPAADLKSFEDRCLYESQTIAREARDKGQAIHDAVQHYIDGDLHLVPVEHLPHCEGAVAKLVEQFGPMETSAWITEESFACKEGYGGRSDLGSRFLNALGDFKCKEFGPDDKQPDCYDEHTMQLASYNNGLGYEDDPEHGPLTNFNLFISTSHPGHCHMVIHPPEDIQFGLDLFMACLKVWQVKNNYRPEW